MDGQEQELKLQGLTVVERARLVKIQDQQSYDDAARFLLESIIPFRKKWAAYWEPVKASAYRTYKEIQKKFAEGDDSAALAEKTVKAEIRRWDDLQMLIEQERQRLAQEAAETRAEEERLRAAIVAEQAGATEEEVSRIVDTSLAVVAEPVEPAYVRTSGISRRENWKARVTDFHALVKAAAKDKSLLPYLQVNESALNARAKADRSTLNIPGVIAYQEAVLAARGR